MLMQPKIHIFAFIQPKCIIQGTEPKCYCLYCFVSLQISLANKYLPPLNAIKKINKYMILLQIEDAKT